MTDLADHRTVDREALIAEAVNRGFKEEVLQRSPTYTIVAMLQGNKGSSRDESSRRSRKHKRAHKPPPGVAKYVQGVTEKLEDTKHQQEFDDTATVVDMNYVTSTENPSDQKYKRFSFLVCAKNELIAAIKTNSSNLQANLDHLDEDDVATVKKEIQDSQYQLNLVNTEIKEIHQWFQEVHAQKQAFYEQFLKQSSDISGKLTSHFQRKMGNIQKYIGAMQEQAQLTVKDI